MKHFSPAIPSRTDRPLAPCKRDHRTSSRSRNHIRSPLPVELVDCMRDWTLLKDVHLKFTTVYFTRLRL